MSVARTAAAACAAGRWFAAGTLLLIVAALGVNAIQPQLEPLPGALLLAALAMGALQMYLAVRIEFDRRIFEAIAGDSDAQAAFSAFDNALRLLGLGQPRGSRTPEQRAAGAARLVRWSGVFFLAQLALVTAAVWLLP